MKISNLTETATPSSMPDPNTAAPKFGRSDEMLESGVGTSTAGGIASVSKPMGKMQKRGQGSMFKGISTSSKYANSKKAGISEDSVNEDELSEEQLQAKKRREENFKKSKDRELGNKPQSREIMTKEAFNGEYDDEAGMADNNLETMRRAVDGIDNVINAGDNLPEWCQEKIAVAKSMLVTVWDYMRSEEEIHEGYYSSYDNNRTGFRKPQRDLSGEGEPAGMFMVMIDGRPWKEFTSNIAFQRAKTLADKNPSKNIQVRWPTGQLNTVKEGLIENENPYGYEVGQTVKLSDGKQGRVIDIFDDSIEVLLTTGRTISVDFQDAQVLDEQGPGQLSTSPTRAVDAKGRTQSQWLKLVKAKFPTAKIIQSKMIDGPAQANLPDGRKLYWSKVEHTEKPQGVDEGQLGNVLPWPEVANKISSAMKAMGWKTQRKGDDAFMFSTKGAEDESQYYMVMIDNEGNGMFTYALGTFEGDRPDIGEQGTLPTTAASVSEVLMAIRDGYGLNEQGVTESSQRVDSLVTDALRIMKGPELDDAVRALKTVLGNREYNDRRGHYNFYVRQILDMYNSQGVAEARFNPDDYSDARTSGDYGMDLHTNTTGSSYKEIDKGSNVGQRGRPSTKSLNGISKALPADAFGRTTGKIPASAKPKTKPDPFKGLDEKAPPGAKAERMVKHIKKGYAKDGKITPKEKSIAYATAWKAHNAGKVEEQGVAEESKGLWANIHAKRERIKQGSGEKMRKPGSTGAPTASALRKSAK